MDDEIFKLTMKVAALEERTVNFEKQYERDMEEIKKDMGGIFKRIEESTEKISSLHTKINAIFSVDIKKAASFLMTIWVVAVVTYIGGQWAKSKFNGNVELTLKEERENG